MDAPKEAITVARAARSSSRRAVPPRGGSPVGRTVTSLLRSAVPVCFLCTPKLKNLNELYVYAAPHSCVAKRPVFCARASGL